jgi:hypothetical protein
MRYAPCPMRHALCAMSYQLPTIFPVSCVLKHSALSFTGRILIVFFILIPTLSGCILERIYRVKNQLCDFDNNFQIETSEGLSVLLREPVLLDDDVTWLTGADPTAMEVAGDELLMRYVAGKRGETSNDRYSLSVELRFVEIDGKYRLKEASLGRNLTDVLTAELLTQYLESVCQSQKSLVNRTVSIDITDIDRSLLPSGPEVVEILGEPNRNSADPSVLSYDYHLQGAEPGDEMATMDVHCIKQCDEIRRINVKYLKYSLDADFEAGVAKLKIHILFDE